uniref:NADH dehydrogenase subunit 4 n=1 Tax=Trifida elongata TaxID=2929027 RepID=UPI002000CBB0|nr:NADH dehydrogenase subunit 4 [Trifida elongata]UNS15664.1 NADH dehydrogenase subunit 4 [Trifida elongata]
MMKLIISFMFLIPLLMFRSWIVIQFSLMMIMVLFMFFNVNFFFSSVSYFMGVDFLSYGLIALSILIVSLMIMSSDSIFKDLFVSLFLLTNIFLCLILIFVFSVLNMFMFYLFFEFSLIPLLILIFGWGYQPERLISGLYLFFYTLFASLPLFLVLIYFYHLNYMVFFDLKFNMPMNFFIHFCVVFAFLVKLPMFMVHFWLPKAHVQAPVSGSMILAGLLLKIGGYGIVRFMYIMEFLFMRYNWVWFSLSLVGAILVSIICFLQGDIKCMIAYSSVAHMGLCIIGLMTMNKWGLLGSYLMMISHGLCSSGLFCLANISYCRFLSRSFFFNKGLLNYMPSMCMLWFLFCSFNMSCPPSLNFMSEIFIVSSMACYWFNSFYYFFFISFLSACFSFYLFSFSQHGNFNFLYSYCSGFVREYLLLMIHLLPIILIMLNLDFYLI